MAVLGEMAWTRPSNKIWGRCQAEVKIKTKNSFLDFSAEAPSYESPRTSTRERRSFSDITNGGTHLVAISPLLAPAAAPGVPQSLVPVDEAADHRPSSALQWLEDFVLESPLALSPDAFSRHLPTRLIDDDEIRGSPDEFDDVARAPTPSPSMQPERLPTDFFAGEDCGWTLGAPHFGDGAENGMLPAFPGWEESWRQGQTDSGGWQMHGCWDQEGRGTTGYPTGQWSWDEAHGEWTFNDVSLWGDRPTDSTIWADGDWGTPAHGETAGDKLISSLTNQDCPDTPEKVKKKGLTSKTVEKAEKRGGDTHKKKEEWINVSSQEKASADVRHIAEGLSGTDTTVMLRNIPNKYSRDMLVEQLSINYSGMFDFMYLPIDFKNKCNVGYSFVNFRTPELCSNFVHNFNGVEVRECLPGFNSRKVAEVTPARVQGLQENVRRLRNSPVMSQLKDNPDWLPLLFDEDGQKVPFPEPDHPLPPVRPRGGRVKDVYVQK